MLKVNYRLVRRGTAECTLISQNAKSETDIAMQLVLYRIRWLTYQPPSRYPQQHTTLRPWHGAPRGCITRANAPRRATFVAGTLDNRGAPPFVSASIRSVTPARQSRLSQLPQRRICLYSNSAALDLSRVAPPPALIRQWSVIRTKTANTVRCWTGAERNAGLNSRGALRFSSALQTGVAVLGDPEGGSERRC